MKIITISREYGSGGRAVAKGISEKLGIEFYDRDIVRAAVEESGLDFDYISLESEIVTRSENFIRSINPISYNQKDYLFEVQKDIILGFAKKGPCVILGRCADAILKEEGFDVFTVFLHASPYVRGKGIEEYLKISDPSTVSKEMHRIDLARKNHYERYTGQHWGDYKNYDLMLDSGNLGIEKTIELICSAVSE